MRIKSLKRNTYLKASIYFLLWFAVLLATFMHRVHMLLTSTKFCVPPHIVICAASSIWISSGVIVALLGATIALSIVFVVVLLAAVVLAYISAEEKP